MAIVKISGLPLVDSPVEGTDLFVVVQDNVTKKAYASDIQTYVGFEEVQTATAGQTVFNLTTLTYAAGANNLQVFVDGVNQYEGSAYTETNNTTVTFTQGLHQGALVKFSTVQTLSTVQAAPTQLAGGSRDAIIYWNANSVKVFRYNAVMGGFRFRGQYTRSYAPVFPMPETKTASVVSDAGATSAVTFENWYAVFACANFGDAVATLKVMPFLRARTVAGSVISLAQLKEGMTSLQPQTYSWTSTNNLANTDVLVITENAAFSGRVAKVTANTTGSITVNTVGSIAAGDTLLPAPPGYAYYVYLGSFYMDTAEVRNIYDSGTLVKSKGIYTLEPNTSTGSFPYPTFTDVNCVGYISPLATAVVLDSSCVLSTASAGFYSEYFSGDSGNHVVQTAAIQKDNLTNLSVVFDNIQVPFLYPQKFSYANDGSLAGTRINGQFNITGWIEP